MSVPLDGPVYRISRDSDDDYENSKGDYGRYAVDDLTGTSLLRGKKRRRDEVNMDMKYELNPVSRNEQKYQQDQHEVYQVQQSLQHHPSQQINQLHLPALQNQDPNQNQNQNQQVQVHENNSEKIGHLKKLLALLETKVNENVDMAPKPKKARTQTKNKTTETKSRSTKTKKTLSVDKKMKPSSKTKKTPTKKKPASKKPAVATKDKLDLKSKSKKATQTSKPRNASKKPKSNSISTTSIDLLEIPHLVTCLKELDSLSKSLSSSSSSSSTSSLSSSSSSYLSSSSSSSSSSSQMLKLPFDVNTITLQDTQNLAIAAEQTKSVLQKWLAKCEDDDTRLSWLQYVSNALPVERGSVRSSLLAEYKLINTSIENLLACKEAALVWQKQKQKQIKKSTKEQNKEQNSNLDVNLLSELSELIQHFEKLLTSLQEQQKERTIAIRVWEEVRTGIK